MDNLTIKKDEVKKRYITSSNGVSVAEGVGVLMRSILRDEIGLLIQENFDSQQHLKAKLPTLAEVQGHIRKSPHRTYADVVEDVMKYVNNAVGKSAIQ